MGAHFRRGQQGYTIIEVMLFFGVTGALMLGVLGSASVGVNTQRYNDAVNTFTAIIQQEFTNVTNVMNTKSVENMCGAGDDSELPRGISNCSIIGRLMTVDENGAIVRSNLVGEDQGDVLEDDTELEIVRKYEPKIDQASKESDSMSWGTKLERGDPPVTTTASILMIRSPRSGNVYSYIINGAVISNDTQLRDQLNALSATTNASEQYLCIDRSGWVATPARAVRLAPFASGPSGVGVVDSKDEICAS